MSRPFDNWFAYSASAWRMFDRCPRAWWWRKVGSWEGWKEATDSKQRLSYVLSKMQSIKALAGTVVHEAAQRMLLAKEIDVERELAWADERLRTAWKDSLRGRWHSDPKNATNLFEHYYDQDSFTGKEPTPNEEKPSWDAYKQARARVHACIQALADHPRVLAARASSRFEVELLEEVEVAGVHTWVQRDLMYLAEDGLTVVIVDWKTGYPRKDHAEQALTYAIPVFRELQLAKKAVAVLVYLPTGEETVIELTEPAARQAETVIADRSAAIKDRLTHEEKNEAPNDHFPPVGSPTDCRRCEYFELCYGARDHRLNEVVDEAVA